jgi:hypothetical protein
MSSDKYADFRRVVYYYWSEITINNNKNAKEKEYRSLTVRIDYLDDESLEYRNNIIKNFREVLCWIDELKYMPPTKIGRFNFEGGYLFHEYNNDFVEVQRLYNV